MTYKQTEASFFAKESSKIKSKIRSFFDKQGFLEVDTPLLVKIPGMEPHLTPFETDLIFPELLNPNNDEKRTKLFLNHSPEIQMKKLLSKAENDPNFKKIYNMGKVFRNTEFGGENHNPEFTMLEWYRHNSDYRKIMDDCENLIAYLTEKNNFLSYQNQNIDISKPFTKKSINEIFIEYTKIDLTKNKSINSLKKEANRLKLNTKVCKDWDDIFFTIFLNKIEPELKRLNKAIILYDYPTSQAALAKKSEKNPFFAERFELYIAGIEIANAFSELIDEKEQRSRLIKEQKIRKKLNKTVFDIDEEFLLCLKSIKHPCSGIALGVDRLIMLLTNTHSIEDLHLFPITHILEN